jgi:hypothetical protein
MSVRKLKPVTPGQRFRIVNGFDAITTEVVIKGDIVSSILSGTNKMSPQR